NCSLKAPESNPELIPLLHKTARSKDKHLASNQDLCGRGLVALGKSLCAIFNDNNEPIEKDLLLEWLCDSSQIFCELMFQLTKTRKYQVYSYVDEKRKSVLVDSKTDKFLFGEDLGKRIKAATMVEKVGLSLKSTPDKVNAAKSSQYLNWKSSTVTPRGQQQSSYNLKAPNKFSRSNRTSVPQTPVRSSTIVAGRLKMFSQAWSSITSDKAVNHLLDIGAIRECCYTDGQYVSSIFLIRKSSGKMRLILNLKKLNNFIDTKHFKLEDIRTV
ncbi:GSCOCG00003700001-RA-CDS, partial [Cotesia congregata]